MKPKLSLFWVVLLASATACGPSAPTNPVLIQPSPTPEPTFTSTPDYSGPCANVFYPLLAGRQWVYQKIGMEYTATPDPLTSKFGMSVAEVSDSQAVVQAVDLASGATTETQVECRDGAITNFPLMTLGSLFGNYLAGDVEVTYVSGVFAPTIADLQASGWNMQWDGEYVVSGTVTIVVEGDQTTITLSDSPLAMHWQNAGQETVTVPAGTFENAYKVTRTTQINATLTLEGMTGHGLLTIETAHWFAPYIGLLKSEILSASLTTFGITFPLEMRGSVELAETH